MHQVHLYSLLYTQYTNFSFFYNPECGLSGLAPGIYSKMSHGVAAANTSLFEGVGGCVAVYRTVIYLI